MQFLATFLGLLVAGSLTMGLPTPSEYSQLAPSERAAIDATKLICDQYPERDWIMIGTQKFDCPGVEKGKRGTESEMTTNVDNSWIVEYRVI